MIALDVDDVLLQWRHGFFAWMHEQGVPPCLAESESSRYDVADAWPNLPWNAIWDQIVAFNSSPGFATLAPVQGAQEGVAALLEQHQPLISITSPGSAEDVVAVRRAQILNFGIKDARILPLGSNKAQTLIDVGAKVLVDDHPLAPLYAQQAGIACLLFDRPYNRKTPMLGAHRVHGWPEVVSWLHSQF